MASASRAARCVLIALAACGAPHVTGDAALRYERGDGVPRDYTRAVTIYAERCARGNGDPVACRKVVDALITKRGDLSGLRGLDMTVLQLLTKACHAGDWLSCIPVVGLDTDRARAACDAGSAVACLALADQRIAPNFNGNNAAEAADRARACRADLLDACIEMVGPSGIDLASVSPDVQRRVVDACQQGDADACAALGQPLAADLLCRAHDFKACSMTGNAADLETACTHGVDDACGKIALAARDADPPDPHVVEMFARACRHGPAIVDRINVCDMNRPVDLAIGCAAYSPIRIPRDQRTALPTGLGGSGRAFAFVGHGGIPPDVLTEVARRLAPDIAVYVQAVGAPLPSAPATAVTLDAALATASIATRMSPVDPRALPFGQSNFVVVDAMGIPRAILAGGYGFVPATLARCIRGLVAEP